MFQTLAPHLLRAGCPAFRGYRSDPLLETAFASGRAQPHGQPQEFWGGRAGTLRSMRQAMDAALDSLTEKEKETLRLIVRGHDAKSAALALDLSVHTINDRLRAASLT